MAWLSLNPGHVMLVPREDRAPLIKLVHFERLQLVGKGRQGDKSAASK
jgi:hypothetical protein